MFDENEIFGIIRKKLIVLLTSIANVFKHKKCVSLGNQKREIQPTLTTS